MKKISLELENKIVNLIENGQSCRKIAKSLNVAPSTVVIVRKRRNLMSSSATNGRPRLLTDADARHIERLMRKNDTKTPKLAAKAINKNVSEWTIRRALRKIGLVSAVKQKKPALSSKNVKSRLQFCKDYGNWTVDDWKRVIWSDETKINRFQSDGKEYYWHRPDEKLQRHQVKQTVKHGGGGLMVWGCFSWWSVGPLVKIEGIMKKEDYLSILQTNLPEFVEKSVYPVEDLVFQQDGDPKHTSKIVKNWLSNQSFQLIKWPPQSPDLNPIENLWAILKRRMAVHERAPTNMAELWQRVQEEWNNISDETIHNLVESMPNRIKSVKKKNKGLWTSY